MSVTFHANTLVINGQTIQTQWPVLEAIEHEDKVFVLLDPDAYLLDADYKMMRRQGAPAIRNLLAFDSAGAKLWEAVLPERSDYYYRIASVTPLIANSFSSFRCEIDPSDGSIKTTEFVK